MVAADGSPLAVEIVFQKLDDGPSYPAQQTIRTAFEKKKLVITTDGLPPDSGGDGGGEIEEDVPQTPQSGPFSQCTFSLLGERGERHGGRGTVGAAVWRHGGNGRQGGRRAKRQGRRGTEEGAAR